MVSIALKSTFNVRRDIMPLRSLILKSFRPCPVLIVAKKNAKNGKNNLSKKNKRRMSIINANNKNYSNKLEEKWKEIELEEGMIVTGNLPPHSPRAVIVVARHIVIIPC
jgi:hypothetical protein